MFEVVLALGAGSSTVKAGETPFGGDWIPPGAYVAMLIGGVVALGYVRSPSHLAALFAPAAALFLLAFSFTYDSYYAPSLVRYEQRDPGNWKLLLVASVVGLLILLWHRKKAKGEAIQ